MEHSTAFQLPIETKFKQSGYHELSRIAVNADATASFAFVMSSGVLWSPGPLSCSWTGLRQQRPCLLEGRE
jgi:hypothetical protein